MFPVSRAPRLAAIALACAGAATLAGCASLSPDGLRGDVQSLVQGRTAGVAATLPDPALDSDARVRELLAAPLTDDAAVRIALLRNPSLAASLAALGVSDAERVQASRPGSPHLSLGRFAEGGAREIERLVTFDVLGLLTLPWRARWQAQQTDLARLSAAQDVVRVAADTRRAWVRAVAARAFESQMQAAHEAAEAGAQLAARMERAGNFSRLRQAREELPRLQARADLARARQSVQATREALNRLLGLRDDELDYRLPSQLPELPSELAPTGEVAARALQERLDVRAALQESRYVADSLGYTRIVGVVDVLELGARRDTRFTPDGAQSTRGGWELTLPLPLFDWGDARAARAEGLYRQSVERVREVALRAASEAREAREALATAHALARAAQDEGVAVQQLIQEETLLRYNGMLASVWDVLAQARATSLAVGRAIDARRDFWLAETDLQQVLTGTSPAALAAFADPASRPAFASPTQGH